MSFTPTPEFGPFIKHFRESKGMSPKDVEEITGVGASTIERWEKGNVQTIRYGTLKPFAEKLFNLTVEDFIKQLEAYKNSVASEFAQAANCPPDDDTSTSIRSGTTEPAAPVSAHNEPIPIRLPPIFSGKRVIYSVVALIVLLALAILAPFAISWLRIDNVTISGTVLCTDNERVVGVWVEAVNGGSNYAHTFRTNSNGSEAAFKYDLPYGGAYNLHVGCGSSKQDWANTDNTEYGSGTIKDHATHFFTCQDVPIVAGHGRCSIKQ